ncbi:MAG: triose-phosphate isomerase [Kordiimonadaceae bacterium]|jgi:triosephosphate isomerase (TIM)|nr:triose-phosphate isomerase [Kordiimonadaceae bacterium]MBT6031331.1 triose-phosphate isomerase [Kordiimonadaceae bacterium]
MTAPKALVAGNWKMNGLKSAAAEITKLNDLIDDNGAMCDVLICPSFTLISTLCDLNADHVAIGAQDCHANASGAHTGDISAAMIKDLGCGHIIVGHSERRADHGESNDTVKAKAIAVQKSGLMAIICVGETIEERKAGEALNVVTNQVRASIPGDAVIENTIIAYEPVWAIGSGLTPTAADVEEVHKAVRDVLIERFGVGGSQINILYGGSVKASNAHELMSVPNVNGALVGGASLKADDFYGIISAYDQIG